MLDDRDYHSRIISNIDYSRVWQDTFDEHLDPGRTYGAVDKAIGLAGFAYRKTYSRAAKRFRAELKKETQGNRIGGVKIESYGSRNG